MAKMKMTIERMQKQWFDGNTWILECTYGETDIEAFSIEFMAWISARKLKIKKTFVGDGKIRMYSDHEKSFNKAKEFFKEKGLID